MQTVNMHEAKTHLSRLVEKASKGEPFIIARAGKPLVKVMAVDAPEPVVKSRFGFLKGMITVPESREDFKAIGAEEIEEMFYGDHERNSCSIRTCCCGPAWRTDLVLRDNCPRTRRP